MANQVVCPNCEGDVKVKTIALHHKTGKEVNQLVRWIFGIPLILFGSLYLFMAFSSDISSAGGTWLFAAFSLLPLVPGIIMTTTAFRATKVKRFTCVKCEHEWTRRADGGDEVKCPACGEVETFVNTITADRKTGNKVVLLHSILGALFALLCIGGALWMAIIIWQGGDTGIVQWQFGSTLAGLGVLAIGISIGRAGAIPILAYFQADRAKLSTGHCFACDHEWKQWEGEEPEALQVSAVSSEETKDK